MALARRTLIMVVVGVVVLVLGVGGGAYLGYNFMNNRLPDQGTNTISDPGPMIDLGQFTSTLADPQVHVVRVKVAVELSSPRVSERLVDPGWQVMMKDEVIKTLKDQRYDSIRFADGMQKLKLDLASRLNAILPRVEGKMAVRQVLFDEYMVQ